MAKSQLGLGVLSLPRESPPRWSPRHALMVDVEKTCLRSWDSSRGSSCCSYSQC